MFASFNMIKIVGSHCGELEEVKWFCIRICTHIAKSYDYEEHGGVPLLGVNGVSIIAHGSAGYRSIKNSILAAKKCIDENLIENTKNSISNYLELN